MRTCDACGLPIGEHEPSVMVQMVIATDPASGRDYYPDELAAIASPFIAAAFATTPGLGGARLTYGAPCFDKLFRPSKEVVEDCEVRKPAPRRRDRDRRERPRGLGETRARALAVEQATMRETRLQAAAERAVERAKRGRNYSPPDEPPRGPRGGR